MQSAFDLDPSGRFFRRNGSVFFLLGDTCWEMVHRLTLDEIRDYADIRAAQGFNAAFFCLLPELDGLRVTNRNVHRPLHEMGPARPNLEYFAFVDEVIRLLAARGIFSGLLPMWGDKWNQVAGAGNEIFTESNARTYGRWLGERYADEPGFSGAGRGPGRPDRRE